MPYLDERFEAAVFTLVGEGSVKDRLVTAYLKHLDDLERDELPRGLRKKFEDLDATLHAVTPVRGEPRARATIRKMSKLQAGKHARTIVSLYADLKCELAEERENVKIIRAQLICRGERADPLKVVTMPSASSRFFKPELTSRITSPTDPTDPPKSSAYTPHKH